MSLKINFKVIKKDDVIVIPELESSIIVEGKDVKETTENFKNALECILAVDRKGTKHLPSKDEKTQSSHMEFQDTKSHNTSDTISSTLDDENIRDQIANSVGLTKSPDLDPKSFKRIQGILSDKIYTARFDS